MIKSKKEFKRDLPTRFGVIPRYGTQEQVRWFEFEPGYVLHMVNAWEEGDWIVMDGCFQPDPTIRHRPEEGELASMLGYLRIRSHLHRWEMNLRSRRDPRARPRRPERRVLPARHAPLRREDAVLVPPVPAVRHVHRRVPRPGEVRPRDRRRAALRLPGRLVGQRGALRAATGRAAEDDGYVVTLMTDAASFRSECWVFAARQIEDGPIARVELPARVPTGFHAKCIPGERVWSAEGN